jgi:ornithine cyclodeaminase/alanine dehydrogenase-like protein (mu-crystallin family)
VNRVACTSALATQLLAREDAADVGLLGSSGQAWAHLVALAAMRRFNRVRVYSPNTSHREALSARARQELGVQVVACESAESVVENSDIVVAATNTSVPIVEGKWLRPGAHVVSIVSGDRRFNRRELDDEVIARAATVIVHDKALAIEQQQGDLAGPVSRGLISWERMHELTELVAGEAPGRATDDDITVFKNNVGIGLQFAAVASRVYDDAKAAGIGRDLPDEWFLQTMKP